MASVLIMCLSLARMLSFTLMTFLLVALFLMLLPLMNLARMCFDRLNSFQVGIITGSCLR